MELQKILNMILTFIKIIFPESRWGNVIYLIVGFILEYFGVLEKLVHDIGALFS